MTGTLFNREAIAARVRATLEYRRLTVRQAGEIAGVSAATISRASRGDRLDVESWLRVELWLDPSGFQPVLGMIRARDTISMEAA